MEHKKKKRVIAIGPRAQSILMSYIIDKEDEPESFLFSPIDTIKMIKVEKRRKRKTYSKKTGRVQPSQRDRTKDNPKCKPGAQYTKDSYNKSIEDACIKADVPKWCPNQLRHSAGTLVRDKFGLDAAQVYLGHSNAKTTEIYAELDFKKAVEIAKKIG